MKNTTKLILANLFALVAVITVFSLSKTQGIELGFSSQALVPSALLLIIPQMGFAYLYWKSIVDRKKAVA
ncbi:hypothetical protein A33Q_0631 [Indibacter alkaliphilus LW1]|jgi:hypothetical protein|uniref:Uncharacterized protein n=1 Tax=Indibacter alkaliphilus (strain CCUG 57479 / KCTC 22604 / LW1) TaxID=1189612 RepID=S2EA87_INDAL|nr:hypothetical protein [Indibacter alkaliphilus]EOZ99253.1 hypothetical protein A33Q_0631 [Indibacter alkaliphilus LW1]